MNFRPYVSARKCIVGAGFSAAFYAPVWHLCPLSEERPLNVPPEHIESHTHHPVETSPIEIVMSSGSGGGDQTLRPDPVTASWVVPPSLLGAC